MRGVRQTIHAAQRRLLVARLIEHCGTGLAWGAATGLAAVAADRLVGFGVEWWWLAGIPAAAGAAIGVTRAVLASPSELTAAGTVDDALSLRDRLTTGLTLTSGQDAAFTQLALREADAAAAQANTRRAVQLQFGSAWYSWPTFAGAAVCVGVFAPQFDLLGREHAAKQQAIENSRQADVAASVAEAIEAVAPAASVDDPKSEASSEQIAELDRLREELEAGTLSADEATAKAVGELQIIAEKSERAADFAAAKSRAMSQSLSGLGKNEGTARESVRASAPESDAPAPAGADRAGAESTADESPLTRAVRNGDLSAAREAARELMKRGTLTAEDRQSLAEDLDRLADDLVQLEAQEVARAKAEAAERAAAGEGPETDEPDAVQADVMAGDTPENAGVGTESEPAAIPAGAQAPAANSGQASPPNDPTASGESTRPPLPSTQPPPRKPEKANKPEAESGETPTRTEKPEPRREQGPKPQDGEAGTKSSSGKDESSKPTGEPEEAKEETQGQGTKTDSKPAGKPDESSRGEKEPGKPGGEQSPSGKPSPEQNAEGARSAPQPDGKTNPQGEAKGEAKDDTAKRDPSARPEESGKPQPGEQPAPTGEQGSKAAEPSGDEQGQPQKQSGKAGSTGGERREVSEQQLREQFEKSGMTPEEAHRAAEKFANKAREEQAQRESADERRELADRLKDAAKSLSGEQKGERPAADQPDGTKPEQPGERSSGQRDQRPVPTGQSGEKQSGAKGEDPSKPSDAGKPEGSKPEAEGANSPGEDRTQGQSGKPTPKPDGEKPSGEGAAKPDPDAKSPGAETAPTKTEPGTVKPEGTPRPAGTSEGTAPTTRPTPQPQGTPPSQGQKPPGVQPKPDEKGTAGTTPREQPMPGETQPGGPKMEAPAADGSKPRAGETPSASERPDGTAPDKTGARPESDAKPEAGDEKSAAESQDGVQGQEPSLPNDIPAPTKESLDQLAKQLERMAAEGEKQKTDRATAERAREQAQKLAEKLSPQQQERLQQWAEGMAKQHPELADRLANQGEQDRPRGDGEPNDRMSGEEGGADRGRPEGSTDTARDADNRTPGGGPVGAPGNNNPTRPGQPYAPKRTELVDARDAGGKRAGEQRDQVVAEWLAPPTPGSASGPGPSAGDRMRQAAKSAQQAVDDRAIPSRYDRLVQRYFRRLPEKVAARAAAQAAPPASVPAQDAP